MRGVAIVIPTRDRGDLVRAAVRSALEQGDDHDVIVVRSNGDTEAAGVGREHPTVRVLTCDGERAAARNAGGAATDRPWVLFLDDDDLLLPGGVAALLAAADEGVAAVRGERVQFADGDPVPRPGSPRPTVHPLARADLVTGAEVLRPSQTLLSAEVVASVPFREDLVPVEDYAMGVTLALRGDLVVATSAITTAYRRHAGQSVGSTLDEVALRRRAEVLDAVDGAGRIDRRLRRRARSYHDLYARLPAAVAAGRRGAAVRAAASAAARSPAVLGDAMWWRAGAHAALRTRRRR